MAKHFGEFLKVLGGALRSQKLLAGALGISVSALQQNIKKEKRSLDPTTEFRLLSLLALGSDTSRLEEFVEAGRPIDVESVMARAIGMAAETAGAAESFGEMEDLAEDLGVPLGKIMAKAVAYLRREEHAKISRPTKKKELGPGNHRRRSVG